MKNINFIIILTIILFLFSCKSEKTTNVVEKVKKQKVKVVTPKFNADSAYHFIEKQLRKGANSYAKSSTVHFIFCFFVSHVVAILDQTPKKLWLN